MAETKTVYLADTRYRYDGSFEIAAAEVKVTAKQVQVRDIFADGSPNRWARNYNHAQYENSLYADTPALAVEKKLRKVEDEIEVVNRNLTNLVELREALRNWSPQP